MYYLWKIEKFLEMLFNVVVYVYVLIIFLFFIRVFVYCLNNVFVCLELCGINLGRLWFMVVKFCKCFMGDLFLYILN